MLKIETLICRATGVSMEKACFLISVMMRVQVVSECRRIGRAGAVFSYVVADMTQYHTEAPKAIQVSLIVSSQIY